MPRLLKPEEVLEEAKAQIEADPTHRFPCVTKLGAVTYMRLIEDCMATGKPLSHQLASVCSDYYELKDKGSGLNLDNTTADLLKALTVFWKCSSEEAIKKLIDKAALRVLEEEVGTLKKTQDLLSSVGAGS